MSDENKDQPQIKIPETTGSVGPSPFEKKAEEKFRNIDTLIYAVVVAIIITAISAVISVGAIVIDQLHFNNHTYREFSDLKKENVELLNRINALENRADDQNQTMIIEQQKQIMELLKKK